MTTKELRKILADHSLWLTGKGGRRADLTDADLQGVDLQGAMLAYACLRGADLINANLSGAFLSYADLSDATLVEANLTEADLTESVLADANLRDADLTAANMTGANLTAADLTNAHLKDTLLGDANLQQCTGLQYALVGWSGHGAVGRNLMCVVIDGAVVYFCGCFRGSADELNMFIDNGDTALLPSRRLALWVVTELLLASKPVLISQTEVAPT